MLCTVQYSTVKLILLYSRGFISLYLFTVQDSTVHHINLIKRRFISWYHVHYSTVQNSTGLYDTVTLIPLEGDSSPGIHVQCSTGQYSTATFISLEGDLSHVIYLQYSTIKSH